MQQEILGGIHVRIADNLESKPMGEHLGQNKTMEKIIKRYYWPRVCSDITEYIRSCDWSQIGIDLMGMVEEIEGYRYILTVIDYFTKWFELAPLKTKSGEELGMGLFKLMT